MSDPSEKPAEAPKADDKQESESSQDKPAKEASDKKGDKTKDKKGGGKKANSKTRLGKNIEIDSSAPVPERDCGPIKAYDAVGYGGKTGNYFALVCEPHLVPRVNAASMYSGFVNPSMAKLINYGIVYWPPAKAERYVFIYSENLGSRLLKYEDTPAMGFVQEDVMDTVVKSIVDVLQDFRDKDFFHGHINPHNMFKTKGSSKLGKIVLGDCLSVPPSYNQPVLYEPIERAMSEPIARGKGTAADDLYALGVSLAVLLRASDPMEGLSDNDIIRQKVELGSYAAVTGKDRFKGSILELLRGLLLDDPSQRWTIDEVLAWLDGRRLSPKQSTVAKKAPRPITYLDNKYFNVRLLSMDLDLNAAEAAKIIENEELVQWLDRSLEDSDAVQRVEEAQVMTKEGGSGPSSQDRLVANLSSALDTMSPIRFKGLRLGGEGIGFALAEAMVLKKDTQSFSDLFSQKVALNWATAQQNPNLDIGALVARYDNCRNFLAQYKVGFGIERCLYVLCPEVHCLSPKLSNYYVTTPEYMVEAFEDLCSKGESPAFFLDKHSIAFLSVKDSKCIDSHLYELDSTDEPKKILGNLKTLASIQKRSNMSPLPAIAKVFLDQMPIVFKSYHDQEVVAKIDKNIKRYAAAGDLVKMAGLLDNPDLKNKDVKAFKMAMIEYANLKKESADLQRRMEKKETFGRTSGAQFASIVATLLSFVIVCFMTFLFLSDKSSF